MIAPAVSLPQPLEVSTLPNEPEWLSAARRSELERFLDIGLPTVREEDWRFTNVKPVAELSFHPALPPELEDLEAEIKIIQRSPFAGGDGLRLVFVNGHFFPKLSSLSRRPSGVRIMSMADALTREPALIERHLFHSSRNRATSFASLNAALFQDGAFAHAPPGVSVSEPVHLLYFFTPCGSRETACPRNLIVAGPGARLTVTESYFGAVSSRYFTNGVTELIVGGEASVEFLKFQDESRESFHLATLAVEAGRDSRVRLHSIALGARLSRTNIHATLAGEGAECLLNGLFLAGGEQLADHYMIVEHAVPRGTSHEYFNGILDGRAKGVFHGRIIVQPDAQKTDAKQTNKNLLLSEDATIDTKPQLEIYADDVKCTHGATVGQLSDEAVFYLRSRGIPREKARRMLIEAFAGEIVDRIGNEGLRHALNEEVGRRLEQNHPAESAPHA